jgi:LytS/YehU family sensor histidine kinase
MIAMVISGIPAGLITYLLVSLLGRNRRIIAYAAGLLVGLAIGFVGMKLVFGHYDILSLGALAGAVLGPVAALRISKPYGFDY